MNAEKPYENSTLYHPDGTFTAEGVREALYRSSSGIAAPNSTLHTVNVNDESRNGNPSAVGLGKYMTDVPPPPPQGKRGAFSLEEDSSMMELFPRRAQKKRRLDEPTTTQEEGSTLPFVETFAHPGDTTISSVQAPSLDQTTNSSLSQNHHNNNDIHNESSSSGRAPEKRIKIVSAVRGMEYLSSGGNHN
ncbi:hypothetical protein AGDE_14563 [Angomonas deanei]|nr:hypothetical protein AGDE_14563 [Angomonas deanei]|eukprot:EPY20639.1 hypothetical protein AGDE_14563 [Angomonas deanei]